MSFRNGQVTRKEKSAVQKVPRWKVAATLFLVLWLYPLLTYEKFLTLQSDQALIDIFGSVTRVS